MKTITILLLSLMTTRIASSQFSSTLYDSYEKYKFNGISTHRFKHADLMKYLDTLKASLGDIIKVEQIGASAENRSINLLTLGSGKTKVLMWSQMHGDEPTATMALLDVLNYIGTNRTSPEVKNILSGTTLLIIPMLNPDGAERFQRRTSQGIDMNRDALALQTPEARILKSIRDKYNPEIGFNLHDQDPRYSVGETGDVSTIALLAPSFNKEKSDNAVRVRAKKITAEIVHTLKQFIPNNISRYDDSFEPRAFGDNIQKWGTSTILIESGGWKNDPAKMYIRKLNCVVLLSEFLSIANGDYEKAAIADYENVPMNTKNLFDVIIENVMLAYGKDRPPVVTDIALNYENVKEANGSYKKIWRVMDVGDLSIFSAHEKIYGSQKTIDGSTIELNGLVNLDNLRNAIH